MRIQATLRAVESIRSLEPSAVEIIVVDDGSTNDLILSLPRFNSSGIPLRVFRLAVNMGPQAARNLGIRRARFSHIAFLDSDDEFHSDKLDEVLSVIRKRDPDLLFHAVSGMTLYNTLASIWSGWAHFVIPFHWLCVLYNPVVTPSLVVRRRIALGPAHLRYCEDWAFLLNYLSKYHDVLYLKSELAKVNRPAGSPGGISSNILLMRQGEFLARSMLVRRSITIDSLLRFALGSVAGLVRIFFDVLRFRYSIVRLIAFSRRPTSR
jgi:glycosyltransferase involved in cell wall biosynthesis